MELAKRQVSILYEFNKELSDKSFQNPLENSSLIADVGELIKNGFLEMEIKSGPHLKISITEKGRLFV